MEGIREAKVLIYDRTMGRREVGRIIGIGGVGTLGITGDIEENIDVMTVIDVDVITVTERDGGRDEIPGQIKSPYTQDVRSTGQFVRRYWVCHVPEQSNYLTVQ